MDTPCINVNLQLSRVLMEVPPRERPLRVQRILDDLIQPGTAPLLLDNLKLLFDPDLQVQPLGWLQRLSRARPVVATWNGSLDQGHLVYAREGEPEYRREPAADILTIICPGPGGA
jgi:hypothetical protein